MGAEEKSKTVHRGISPAASGAFARRMTAFCWPACDVLREAHRMPANRRPSCDVQTLRSPLGKSHGGRFCSFLRPPWTCEGQKKRAMKARRLTPFLALLHDP